MEQKHWLIYSREHNAWWRPNSAGYTTSIDVAGRYTHSKACTIVVDANARCGSNGEPPYEFKVPDPEAYWELVVRSADRSSD